MTRLAKDIHFCSLYALSLRLPGQFYDSGNILLGERFVASTARVWRGYHPGRSQVAPQSLGVHF